MAKWSARRPWRAIALWLAFVAVVGAIGFETGIASLNNGAVGESARGYDLIDEHQAYGPAREYGYLHSAVLTARDPAFRAAVRDVSDQMNRELGNIQVRTSADGHAVLVVGEWIHPFDVDALRSSVLG